MSGITRQQLVSSYVSAIRDGEAALFIGAGMSRPSGYVDWKGLLRGCAAEIGLDLEREHDLVAVAQYYLNFHGGYRWRLNQLLKNEFDRRGTATQNHRVIGRLPIATIWTTNFDSLLEQCLIEAGRTVDIKSRDEDIALAKRGHDVVVYKMHGDIARPDEVVICKADYERYTVQHQIFQNALEADLVSKTFLFLGFSFADPNLNYMLGHLHALLENSKREHYAIMRRVRVAFSKGDDGHRLYAYEKNKQDLLIKELQRYNIQTHLIEKFSEVTDILSAIEDRSFQRNVFVSGSANKFGEFDENRMRDLCMHLGETLMENDFKLISGIGLNIGDSVVKGALLSLYEQRETTLEKNLMLRPFPRSLPHTINEAEFLENYRQSMISQCGFAIFISGTSRSSELSSGVLAEYQIARNLHKIPIPVAATGFAARQIWEALRPEILSVYGGVVDQELFDSLNDGNKTNQELLDAIFKIIALCSTL